MIIHSNIKNYSFTTLDVAQYIRESTTLEELDYIRKNIEIDEDISKNNKDILLTMINIRYLAFPLSEVEDFYKKKDISSSESIKCKDNNKTKYNSAYVKNRRNKALVQSRNNIESLTKTEISRRTKICPYCHKMFRIDKESHFKEKNKKPRRIHENCIKDHVREKYNVSQQNLYKFINNNYDFIDINK